MQATWGELLPSTSHHLNKSCGQLGETASGATRGNIILSIPFLNER
jgi:hypothetical protein